MLNSKHTSRINTTGQPDMNVRILVQYDDVWGEVHRVRHVSLLYLSQSVKERCIFIYVRWPDKMNLGRLFLYMTQTLDFNLKLIVIF